MSNVRAVSSAHAIKQAEAKPAADAHAEAKAIAKVAMEAQATAQGKASRHSFTSGGGGGALGVSHKHG